MDPSLSLYSPRPSIGPLKNCPVKLIAFWTIPLRALPTAIFMMLMELLTDEAAFSNAAANGLASNPETLLLRASIDFMELGKPSWLSAFWKIPFNLDRISDVLEVRFSTSAFIFSIDFPAPDISIPSVLRLKTSFKRDSKPSDLVVDVEITEFISAISELMFFVASLPLTLEKAFLSFCKADIVSSAFLENPLLSRVTFATFSSTYPDI